MTTYLVWKTLSLSVKVDAESEQDAIDQMLEMDDTTFVVDGCDYGAIRMT